MVASLFQALAWRLTQTIRRLSQLGDLALTLQREVGTEECSLAWESDDLNRSLTFYAPVCDAERVPSSMYLSLPICKELIQAGT